jgi:hypothetical protein
LDHDEHLEPEPSAANFTTSFTGHEDYDDGKP